MAGLRSTGAAGSAAPVARPGPLAALVVALAVLSGAACSSSAGPDREALADQVIDDAAGLITDEQARCYVDRVIDEIGPSVLEADADPSDAQHRRLTAIRVDCIGIAGLGLGRGPDDAPIVGTMPLQPGPRTFGDDPVLDELWASCEGGDGAACDQLFEQAPLASDYETFGATCGGRGAEPSCEAARPST